MTDIQQFNEMNDFQKRILLALADQSKELQEFHKEILGDNSRKLQVVFAYNDIAVCEQATKPVYEDARFTFLVKEESGWRGGSVFYADAENAYLGGLGRKYEGLNSQFANYASKMLGKTYPNT